ncbi:unnamed protein product [Meloidogyne enterolobii]|uniref:Uncharacterized protein n=1 Tax=Meloidogyne enterolobii TaxID=390850 RepID=A0ACB0YR36_MELEN
MFTLRLHHLFTSRALFFVSSYSPTIYYYTIDVFKICFVCLCQSTTTTFQMHQKKPSIGTGAIGTEYSPLE